MDNVTHSLFGVLLARASTRWTGSLRGALWAAILASNIPDIDLVQAPFFSDPRLGYLVHHRGYTHTLPVAIALGLACAGIAKWRDRAARTGPLLALAMVASLLHIAADYCNNYGVHPFWPFENAWHYGDTLFIVEPLLWVTLLPLAWTSTARRSVHAALALLGVATIVMGAAALGPIAAIVLAFLLAGMVLLQSRRDTIALPVVGMAATLLAFGYGHHAARSAIASARPHPLDLVLTPRPATPWCWEGIVLSRDEDTYTAENFRLSLLPSVTRAADCSLRPNPSAPPFRTAPGVGSSFPSTDALMWGSVFSAPISQLSALSASQCRVDAALHFMRAPFWTDDGEAIVIGDLRYDYEPGLGFAEIATVPPDTRGCGHLPPWESPTVRALLGR